MVYVHWEGCPGHKEEFQWIPASQLGGMGSINSKLQSEATVVFWVAKLGQRAVESKYHGMLEAGHARTPRTQDTWARTQGHVSYGVLRCP